MTFDTAIPPTANLASGRALSPGFADNDSRLTTTYNWNRAEKSQIGPSDEQHCPVDLTAAFRDAFRSFQRPQSHHLPPINIASVAYPDNGYQQDTIVKVGDDAPVVNAVFSEIAEVFLAKRFAYAAWIVENGATGVRVGVDIDPYSFV